MTVWVCRQFKHCTCSQNLGMDAFCSLSQLYSEILVYSWIAALRTSVTNSPFLNGCLGKDQMCIFEYLKFYFMCYFKIYLWLQEVSWDPFTMPVRNFYHYIYLCIFIMLTDDRLTQSVWSVGEFTLRAFLNGRLDLSQAENIGRLISAKSVAAADSALAGMQVI